MTNLTIPSNSDLPFRITLPPAPDLSNSLLSYQRQSLFCDVLLRFSQRGLDRVDPAVQSDDLYSLPAHKVVLAAASPFFRQSIEECSNDVIAISWPVDELSMKIIVEWIYGGVKEVELWKHSLAHLAAIGESLQLFALVDAIRDEIREEPPDDPFVSSSPGENDPFLIGGVEIKEEADEVEGDVETNDGTVTAGRRGEARDSVNPEAVDGASNWKKNGGMRCSKRKLPICKDDEVVWTQKRRKKKKKPPPAPPPTTTTAVSKVVKPPDICSDLVLSPMVDANFVFRCREPGCGESIRRDAPGRSSVGNMRLFARRCAKHLWVHHRIVCPTVYSRCKEPNCEYAGQETDLARHTKFKHHKEKIPCSICGKLVQENSLKNHIDLIHKDANQFPCPTCGKSFSRKHFLTLHENSVHKKGDEYVRRCELCDYETAYKPMLVQHAFTRHDIMMPGAKLLTCDICGVFKTPLLKLLNRHKKRKKECGRGIGNAPIPCEECGKMFKGPYEVKTHKHRMHQDGDVGMCPVCGEVFRSKSGLKYHLWRVHHQGNNGFAAADVQFRLEKPFRCAYCPHASGLSGNCRKHIMRAHPGLEVKYVDLRTIATAEERFATLSFAAPETATATTTTTEPSHSTLMAASESTSAPDSSQFPALALNQNVASLFSVETPRVIPTAAGDSSILATASSNILPSVPSSSEAPAQQIPQQSLSDVVLNVTKNPPQTFLSSLPSIHGSTDGLRLATQFLLSTGVNASEAANVRGGFGGCDVAGVISESQSLHQDKRVGNFELKISE